MNDPEALEAAVRRYFAALDEKREWAWSNLQVSGAARERKVAKLGRELRAAEDALRGLVDLPLLRPSD